MTDHVLRIGDTCTCTDYPGSVGTIISTPIVGNTTVDGQKIAVIGAVIHFVPTGGDHIINSGHPLISCEGIRVCTKDTTLTALIGLHATIPLVWTSWSLTTGG